MPCECPSPGFCRRHNMEKGEQLWSRCRSDPRYFELFERQSGRATGIGDTVHAAASASGLKFLVDTFKAITGKSCGCEERRKWLNEQFPYRQVKSWAVGMTTCPRKEPTIDASLASLSSAGWGEVHVSDDKGRSGAWNNFCACLSALVNNSPDADAYLVVQDDIECAANLREWLERVLWPTPNQSTIGAVSLYTARMHHRNEPCWYAVDTPETYGGLAYIFTPLSARLFLGTAEQRPKGAATVDLKVGRFCRSLGLQLWMHSPSLIRHTGRTSTISSLPMGRTRQCARFCEDAAML